jgi:hypothetical protein
MCVIKIVTERREGRKEEKALRARWEDGGKGRRQE